MSAQDVLTLLFNAIALTFITIATLDFISGLMPLISRYKMPIVSPGQLSLFDCKSKPLPLLPDPWTLALDEIAEVTVQPQQTPQTQHQPVLLLSPVKEASIQPPLPTAAEPKLEQFLSRINIDKLQLRPARKIAKALNIAQKINGRNQTLLFFGIKSKLNFN